MSDRVRAGMIAIADVTAIPIRKPIKISGITSPPIVMVNTIASTASMMIAAVNAIPNATPPIALQTPSELVGSIAELRLIAYVDIMSISGLRAAPRVALIAGIMTFVRSWLRA
jgi:hypothetical protein